MLSGQVLCGVLQTQFAEHKFYPQSYLPLNLLSVCQQPAMNPWNVWMIMNMPCNSVELEKVLENASSVYQLLVLLTRVIGSDKFKSHSIMSIMTFFLMLDPIVV
jgi:hypothetical protein